MLTTTKRPRACSPAPPCQNKKPRRYASPPPLLPAPGTPISRCALGNTSEAALADLRVFRPDPYHAASLAHDAGLRQQVLAAELAAYRNLSAVEKRTEKRKGKALPSRGIGRARAKALGIRRADAHREPPVPDPALVAEPLPAASPSTVPSTSPLLTTVARACRACERMHPLSDFHETQLALAPAGGAVCKGREGEMEVAPDMWLGWEKMRKLLFAGFETARKLEADVEGKGVWIGENDPEESDDEEEREEEVVERGWARRGTAKERCFAAEDFVEEGRRVTWGPFLEKVMERDVGRMWLVGFMVMEVRKVGVCEQVHMQKQLAELEEMQLCAHMSTKHLTGWREVEEKFLLPTTTQYDCYTIVKKIPVDFMRLQKSCRECMTHVEVLREPLNDREAWEMQIVVLRNIGLLEDPTDKAWVGHLEYFD